MSTHNWHCAWCGAETICDNEEHILGAGQTRPCNVGFRPISVPGEGLWGFGFDIPAPIEFCSLKCFEALRVNMEERLKIAKEDYPEWFENGE
jgi:hypothetical protein